MSPYSIDVTGSFQFDSASQPEQTGRSRVGGRKDRAGIKEDKKKAKRDKKEAKERKKKGLPPVEVGKKKIEEGIPFSLRDIDLRVPKGMFLSPLT